MAFPTDLTKVNEERSGLASLENRKSFILYTIYLLPFLKTIQAWLIFEKQIFLKMSLRSAYDEVRLLATSYEKFITLESTHVSQKLQNT